MVRIILGVVVGFIVWSILWIGSDQVLMNLSKDWYGVHQLEFERAVYNGTPFMADTTIVLTRLIISVIASLMSGFIAAFVARESSKAPLALGVLLLLVGIMFQVMVWNYMPVWFHVAFLLLLIPVTVIGGKLRRQVAPVG